MRPQQPPRNAGASLPTTPGSCCAAQEPYVVAPSVVSAATTPPRPYSKKRDPDTVALRAPLAQLAEQLTLNQRVGGSIPSRRTLISPSQRHLFHSGGSADFALRGPCGHRLVTCLPGNHRHRTLGSRPPDTAQQVNV